MTGPFGIAPWQDRRQTHAIASGRPQNRLTDGLRTLIGRRPDRASRGRCALGRTLLSLGLCIGIVGCGTISRAPITAHALTASPYTAELDRYRFPSVEEGPFFAWLDRWAAERRALGLDGVKGLALSGGGASGAFGAGVLVGWSRHGDRPRFDIVTGVSTGALAAPLAFAGPGFDDRLAAAYQDRDLRALTSDRLGVLRNPSLYPAGPLKRLVERYVTDDLLQAVASEHAAGRRLLVATTNLDTRAPVIWDLGAIATDAVDGARHPGAGALFRQVLVAAASIPGVFPPVMMSADPSGRVAEMHVDGGVTAPFFLVPETLNFWRPQGSMRPTELYLIINGQTGTEFSATRGTSVAIIERTLDTLGRADARSQLRFVAAFASRNGASVAYAAIPDGVEANPLMFDVRHTARLFALGRDRAMAGEAFAEPGVLEWLADDAAVGGRPQLIPRQIGAFP
jgi:hypothetical protein